MHWWARALWWTISKSRVHTTRSHLWRKGPVWKPLGRSSRYMWSVYLLIHWFPIVKSVKNCNFCEKNSGDDWGVNVKSGKNVLSSNMAKMCWKAILNVPRSRFALCDRTIFFLSIVSMYFRNGVCKQKGWRLGATFLCQAPEIFCPYWSQHVR